MRRASKTKERERKNIRNHARGDKHLQSMEKQKGYAEGSKIQPEALTPALQGTGKTTKPSDSRLAIIDNRIHPEFSQSLNTVEGFGMTVTLLHSRLALQK
jgi:hypothetical protein